MSRGRWIWIALALVAVGGAVARHRGAAHASVAGGGLARMWTVPHFRFVDQANRPVTDGDLRGHPWIADFIFTSCASACPLLTARMVAVQQRLAGADVGFVSFSVDPEHDTPAALADYARRWHADPRWRLLATTHDGLRALAAGMKATVQATGVPADPVMHSTRLQLVDGDGVVRGLYDSSDDAAVDRLVADARSLARAPAASPPLPTDGAQLFAALGCAGCHGDGRVARRLDGLAGSRVTLDDGKSVVADAAYLRESIVDPQAKRVAGTDATMPSYASTLDAARVDALVGYLQSLAPHR